MTRLDRHMPVQDREQTDPGRPYIRRTPFIPMIKHYFRRDISWSSTLLKQYFIDRAKSPAHSKIADLHITMAIQQNILQLDIPVDHLLLMHVENAEHQLSEYEFCLIFVQFPTFAHIVKQIASWAKLDYHQEVFLVLECLQQLDETRVSQWLKDVNFVLHLLFLCFFICGLLKQRLDGNKFSS